MRLCAMLDRLQKDGVLMRPYLYAVSIWLVTFSVADKDSQLYDFFTHNDYSAWVRIAVLCSAVVGLWDSFINDVLPPGWILQFGLKWRHLILMSMAWWYAVAASFAWTEQQHWLLGLFVLQTVAFSATAFFDIRRRFKRG